PSHYRDTPADSSASFPPPLDHHVDRSDVVTREHTATKTGKTPFHPAWLLSRQLPPRLPRRSQPRCSISTRVLPMPRSRNRISTSVASAGGSNAPAIAK